jgi:hypothetical protein
MAVQLVPQTNSHLDHVYEAGVIATRASHLAQTIRDHSIAEAREFVNSNVPSVALAHLETASELLSLLAELADHISDHIDALDSASADRVPLRSAG